MVENLMVKLRTRLLRAKLQMHTDLWAKSQDNTRCTFVFGMLQGHMALHEYL